MGHPRSSEVRIFEYLKNLMCGPEVSDVYPVLMSQPSFLVTLALILLVAVAASPATAQSRIEFDHAWIQLFPVIIPVPLCLSPRTRS